ncbi:MAG: hypothetical protein Q7K25_09895 [Actinomycetota bacterium]|nr:hypothetical protein [Actinomycetota bacterium]
METHLDPLEAWQQEIEELRFTVDLPLLPEPAAFRSVSARISKYMSHFARYRRVVQSVSGYTEAEGHQQLRDAISAIGHELQSPPLHRHQMQLRMETLSSLVRLELEREREFVAMLTTRLDAPQKHALSTGLQGILKSEDQGSSSDGDESWASAPTKVDPAVDRSTRAVIERGDQHE